MNGATVLTKFTADTKDFDSKTKSVNASISSIAKGVLTATGITKAFSSAWNMVTNSIDSAIDRYDTLQNFPKVMSNLGISAEESQKSIDKLSDKLTGLPTTLQDGALAVQRLTSKNGDIKKSTDLFLAMNNAILAGGASAQIQSSAIEQLSQAYAKGKPDMMEWRSLMTAMPAQLKQVAQAMGYIDADALGEALRDGSESMDNFMATITRLNTEGVNGFKSFEDQAKNSTGGIRTAITNMHSRVTQGVAAVIEAVNTGLEEAGLGNIAGVFEQIGNTIRDSLKGATPVIKDVIKGLSSMLKGAKKLIPYLKSIGAVVVAWKVGTAIQGIVTGFQSAKLALALFTMQTNGTTIAQAALNGTLTVGETIVALLTGKLKLSQLATAGLAKAQAGLNAVWAANPIGVIIAAVVGLIAIFVLLWNKCEGFRNFWKGLWEHIKLVFEVFVAVVTDIAIRFISFFQSKWNTLKDKIITPIQNGINAAKEKFETFITNVKSFIKRIIDAFKELPGKLKEIGKQMIQGLIDGVKSMADKAVKSVKNVGKSILNGAKSVLGIHSPSKEFAMIGRFSILGYTEQLDKMQKDVQGQIAETFQVSPQLANSSSLHYSPNVNVINNVDITQDPLGQMVNNIKTFAGGAKNDYNYGAGF